MAFAKFLRGKMLETCHLACIEDDNERETFIQRVGAVMNDTEYLRLATADVRARKVSETLYPSEVLLMKIDEEARIWLENSLGPSLSSSEVRKRQRRENKKLRKAGLLKPHRKRKRLRKRG